MTTAHFKYYTHMAMVFVTLLLTANVISEKPLLLGWIVVPAGLLLFPITYLLGGVLAEVYGFAKSRQVIWMSLVCNLFLALICHFTIQLPALDTWELNSAYTQVLERSSRLIFISVFAYCVGELINAYVVVQLKAQMQGKRFWIRSLCGSWMGEAVETALFVPLAFYQTLTTEALFKLTLFYYCFKFLYAFLMVPFTNKLAVFLKKQEGFQENDDLGDLSIAKIH